MLDVLASGTGGTVAGTGDKLENRSPPVAFHRPSATATAAEIEASAAHAEPTLDRHADEASQDAAMPVTEQGDDVWLRRAGNEHRLI